MQMLTARSQTLRVWRAGLALAALPPSFLSSLIFRPGGAVWWVLTCTWVLGFLLCYLYYLPAMQRALCLTLREDKLTLTGGVFTRTQRTVPLSSIQYARIRATPLHRRLGLATLIVVCAGGRTAMPGLSKDEAEALLAEIFLRV